MPKSSRRGRQIPGGRGKRGCPRRLKRRGARRTDDRAVSRTGRFTLTLPVAAQECIQKRAVRYDKDGDNHYDTISAFIKSMRGSDPDAGPVYYLARMLYAGEDVKFIARRIMICAAEDVGNADPQALTVAGKRRPGRQSGSDLPEAQIIL